jgi:hypothetical protein
MQTAVYSMRRHPGGAFVLHCISLLLAHRVMKYALLTDEIDGLESATSDTEEARRHDGIGAKRRYQRKLEAP